MDFVTGIIAVLIVLLLTWYWFNSKPAYWVGKDIVTADKGGVFGVLKSVLTTPFHEIVHQEYKKYGRLYGCYEGRTAAISIGDPNLLKNIFLKDFQYFMNPRNLTVGDGISDNMLPFLSGDKWKRMRTIISPTFSTGKIKKMTSIILDSAETLCQNFSKAAKEGTYINTKSVFGAFTMDAIASTAFGTKVDSHNDVNNKFIQAVKEMFGYKMPIKLFIIVLFPMLARLFRITLFAPKTISFLRGVTLNIIKERRRTRQVRNDFLQLVMDVSELGEDASSTIEVEEQVEDTSGFKLSGKHKKLTQDELLAQCISFFLAGYEAISTSLGFVAYELAVNPECQERLIKELDTVLADSKGEITYDAIQNMKYLDNVINESLRKHPSSFSVQRQCSRDYPLPGTDIVIPKGMSVMIPVIGIHHDEEFFPNPGKFDPDRFATEEKSTLHQYAYIPFGAGPRMCIASRFSLMEMKLCVARILSEFRLKMCPETKVPLEYKLGQLMLHPKHITLAVEERTDKI